MTKTIALSTVAVLALTGGAFAQETTGQIDDENYGVGITIDVQEEVSVWAGDENITLTMNGADGNNFAGAASTLTHITNVDANITATLDGPEGALPGDGEAGGEGINVHLFYGTATVDDAQAATTANAYTPAGALTWYDGNLGTSQEVLGGTGPTGTAVTTNVVYAATAPGNIPAVGAYDDLVMTYTITANNGGSPSS